MNTIAQLEHLLGQLRGAAFPPVEGFDPTRDMDAEATSLLGFAYASQGRLARGIAYMERGVQMAPQRAPLWVGLGTQYREIGRKGDAETAYLRAVAVDPKDVQARIVLATFLLQEGRADQALEVAGGALRLEPANARAQELVTRATAAARK